MTGRPSSYTAAIGATICDALIEGDSLRTICKRKGMPGLSTIFQWLKQYPAFAEQYTRAREIQAHVFAEETREIVDMETDPARARVRFDQRRWHAGKLLPKVYGDKVQSEISGPDGGPLQVSQIRRVIVDPAGGSDT